MTTQEMWEQYKRKRFVISAYNLVLSTTYFDADTIAPVKGRDYRNARMAYLSGEVFDMQTDPEFIKLREDLLARDDLTFEQRQILKWELRDLETFRYIPKDLFVEDSELTMKSNVVWKEAKNKNDYKLFEPYLLKIIDMRKKLLQYRHSDLEGYDIYLSDYEPGMTVKDYDAFFDLIREKLVPLIKKISAAPQIDTSFAAKHYPAELQKKLMYKILDYMRFDRDAGVLAETEHPFMSAISKYDVRVTTHYYEDNLLSSIFSVIHEAGHATYNYQIADELAETYAFDCMSSGMHESQSRLMENYLGRNSAFWDNLYPEAVKLFPEQLEGISQQQFVEAANASVCSLIRTEADELTYPLHILIRYEIEKGIFDGSVDVNNLEQIWNDKYEEYLGVRPTCASEGILQDVHWSGGSFGYFPTYALGSGYSAQFMHAMRKDLDVEACLRENRYDKIREWLKEHIHKYGGLYLPKEQIKIATGEEFNPQYYVDYLVDKYSKLYKV